jgi:hypothetical protein
MGRGRSRARSSSGARTLLRARRQGLVRHAERAGDPLAQQIGVGPVRGLGQRSPEQVEAHVRVGDRAARRPRQLLVRQPIEPVGRGRPGERRRARRRRQLARQRRRMGGEVEQGDRPAADLRHACARGRVALQRLDQAQASCRSQRAEQLSDHRLRDRAEPEQRLAVRLLAAAVCGLAEADDQVIIALDHGKDHPGRPRLHEHREAGQTDRLLEQGAVRPGGTRRCQQRNEQQTTDGLA